MQLQYVRVSHGGRNYSCKHKPFSNRVMTKELKNTEHCFDICSMQIGAYYTAIH